MLTFEKILEVFKDYLNQDDVFEVVNTKRGYTVMIWDGKDEQWFGVQHCKTPELLRDALLEGYHDYSEQQLTHNRRNLTEHEIAYIHDADTEVKKKELFAKVRSGKCVFY